MTDKEQAEFVRLAADMLPYCSYVWLGMNPDSTVTEFREWEHGWWTGFNFVVASGINAVKSRYRKLGKKVRYEFVPVLPEYEQVITCGLADFFIGRRISSQEEDASLPYSYLDGREDGLNAAIRGLGKWMDRNGLYLRKEV